MVLFMLCLEASRNIRWSFFAFFQANEKSIEVHNSSSHGNHDAPSSSSAANGDADDVPDDIDDDLDEDELEELEASLSKASIQIKEPGTGA